MRLACAFHGLLRTIALPVGQWDVFGVRAQAILANRTCLVADANDLIKDVRGVAQYPAADTRAERTVGRQQRGRSPQRYVEDAG